MPELLDSLLKTVKDAHAFSQETAKAGIKDADALIQKLTGAFVPFKDNGGAGARMMEGWAQFDSLLPAPQ